MSAHPPTEMGPMVDRSWQPLYFPSGQRQLFAWLHRPVDRPQCGLGVVICKPIGHESIAAHRTMRDIAERAGRHGIPVLWFDYSGTGDSSDLDPSANQLDVWRDDTLAAVKGLLERTGVSSVCLLGMRLGAAVAALAASKCERVSALVAIAPIVNGRRYLRELRVAQLAASTVRATAAASSSDAAQHSPRGSGLEASGTALSAATLAALARLDVTQLATGAVSATLIVDRTDLPAAGPWSEQLARRGVRTQYAKMQGFVEILIRATHMAGVPHHIVDTVDRWLAELKGERREGAEHAPLENGRVRADAAPATLRIVEGDSDAIITERPVIFGSGQPLFGIVSQPRAGEVRRRGVILINSGADNHIGPNRLHVSLGRRWARRGYVVLRMDFAGIGDSPPRERHPVDDVFTPEAMQDIRAAIEFMRDRYQVRELTIGGLCAGAYHALQAAACGLPVNRIVLINALIYGWKAGLSVDDFRRVLRREVSPGLFLRLYGKRACLGLLEFVLRFAPRRLRDLLGDNLGAKLERIAGRGVTIVFVFARGDGGEELLRGLAGSSLEKIARHCRIRVIDGADHGFSRSSARTQLEEVLSVELCSPAAQAHPAAIGKLA